MEVIKFTFNPIQENTYLVFDTQKNGVIIDPGCYFPEEKELINSYIKKHQITILAILNTHAHLDHVMGNAYLQKTTKAPIYLHEKDLPTLAMAEVSANLYEMHLFEPSPQPSNLIKEDDLLIFGSLKFKVIFGPGHAPGHVAFYNEKERVIFNGDILFKGSYGRVDLPGGNFEDLKHTITQKLFLLPDQTLVYTGHGEETTIGEEKQNNPILW